MYACVQVLANLAALDSDKFYADSFSDGTQKVRRTAHWPWSTLILSRAPTLALALSLTPNFQLQTLL